MMMRRPVFGFTAHCTFEPPVEMPIASSTASESSRIAWYSASVSVWIGATVIESPVWMPIGSRFSIEQTMTPLPFLSRITSISYSFQPRRDSSIRTSELREASRPRCTIVSNSSSPCAMPPPVPPSVKPGRMMSGQVPIFAAAAFASAIEWQETETGMSRPSRSMASLKSSRSSARAMASASAPIISTL